MRVWAIADLHLSFGVQNKSMEVFGPHWKAHADQIASNWQSVVHPEDLVLIPGDISWAMKIEEAAVDLEWIHALNGTKVMIKGNHDYWWGSLSKILPILPPSIHLIQNNAFHWKDVAVAGARLWDTPEFSYSELIQFDETKKSEELVQEEFSEKLFNRELERLKMSLAQMDPNAKIRIVMTHYPPIGPDLAPSRASQILEQHEVQVCVFGHLHNLKESVPFGEARGVRYLLAASDYIHFQPIAVL